MISKVFIVLVVLLSASNAFAILQDRSLAVEQDDMTFMISADQRKSLLQMSNSTSNVNTILSEAFDADWLSRVKQSYDDFGLVLIRGLLDDAIVSRLGQAGDLLVHQSSSSIKSFNTIKFGPIFLSPPSAATVHPSDDDKTCSEEASGDSTQTMMDNDNIMGVFRDVALYSAIPTFIAKMLLHLDESTGSTLRVVSDVFFSKGNEQGYCGWHVDDFYFWPTAPSRRSDHVDNNLSSSSSDGVNAWIAIDDITSSQHGGGLAVVPKSHVALWRYQAYNIIGSLPVFPEEGYSSAENLFSSFPVTTCDLAHASPELSELMDKEALIFDYTKGDVLLMNRWVWHKSLQSQHGDPLKRYSIRYDEGTTRLQKGFSPQLSIMHDPDNSGRSLNEISERSGPFFPQAFPNSADELLQFNELIEHKFPIADARKQVKVDEIRKHFFARGKYYTL